ncbi:MAG: hypothetical protein H7Z42_11685 [Roseiflexaceae bacterium]|nr:hypothetical protein [Roseiflexaceae bacterium]
MGTLRSTTTDGAPRRSSYVKKNVPTGRKPELYVRLQRRKNSKGLAQLELQLGRAAWYALDRPERVALEWHGDQVRVVPDQADGWKLHIRQYATPRCWLPGDIDLEAGRYAVTVRNGAIVLGVKEQD